MSSKNQIIKDYKKKIKNLIKHNKLYFLNDAPQISDKQYDEIKKEVLNLENKYSYLKNLIIENYEKTVFVEEALHRLVEINYYLGLEAEAKKYAKILGYNYNSSEWFEQSYKILNKDYKIAKKGNSKDETNFFRKILQKIK